MRIGESVVERQLKQLSLSREPCLDAAKTFLGNARFCTPSLLYMPARLHTYADKPHSTATRHAHC